MMMKKIVGPRIRELRREMGLKQEELAEKLNMSKSSIGMYERNERKPDYDTLQQIADFFGVSRPFLLGDSDQKKGYDDFDSLAAIKEIVEDLEIEDLFFHNIDDLKNLSPEDVEDIRHHLEYTLYKARQRKKKEDKQ
ncbi:helix-turn-helix domain-containing protein [Lentibacillus amyloliquefaciens]|nr:helix-turn-helix domain-containing protein [Lentibacillus amyloliquefaciens]